ncbi:thiamine diphosphokinase [Treponema brennaborense]|uniref:Thiamine diphosphokinase n=1 Tax=Treponema brennaborense (strain DSM 12168 / CIP 105900 / DD5/3) TaxID=906968 RepID=F4LMP9_TREBD|nr:thiamine diphosphokinase [Treponema brennaborense]AEE16796.1 thiamine pyrophosphokinase [Treponema brennaborense DSM 12168]
MNVCVFTGGEYPAPELARVFFERRPDFVIAADSGLDAAEAYGAAYGFVPDLIIGDMDSLREPDIRLARYGNSRVKRFARDKDYTDTELALKEAYACIDRTRRAGSGGGAADVTLIGGDGGRIDHLFAIRNLFGSGTEKNCAAPRVWLCRTQAVFYLDAAGTNRLTACGVLPDDDVSVFSVGNPAVRHCAHSENLRWPLAAVDWDSGAYSLSNRLDSADAEAGETGSRIGVTAVSGAFIVIVPLRLRSALCRCRCRSRQDT